MEQFAAGAPDAGVRILEFVERLEFGALGTVGGGLLIFTTLLAVGNVERALNAIWGVTHQRPWVRRVPDYLAVVMISPLLLGVALSLAASVDSQWIVQKARELPWLASLLDLGLSQTPLLLVVAGFAFLYWFLPNTEVRFRSALLGAVVAGILFGIAQRLYVGLSVGAARYDAIFGGFAALPLLMVWVYVSCAITLLGAEVAYAHQTLPLYRREVHGATPGPAAREGIGLSVALVVARAFRDGTPPFDESALSDHLDVPVRTVREIAAALEKAGILAPVADAARQGVWQLGRAADHVRVVDVLDALRGSREAPVGPRDLAVQVGGVLAAIDAADHQVASQTLAELLDGPPSVDGGDARA